MLREARGMMFAVGAITRGLEVGGRWERIGVEVSAQEFEVEVDMIEGLDITRIA